MADTFDVLTLAEAKATLHIGTGDVSRDTELVAEITNVSRQLDRCVGPVVKRTVTAELHDGGNLAIWLRFMPVFSITSITEHITGVPTVLPAETPTNLVDGYLAQPYEYDPSLLNGEVYRRQTGRTKNFWWGRRNIAATYIAGRSATTAAVDPKYKQAARIILRNLWRADEQSSAQVGEYDVPAQNFPKFGIPNAARDLLKDEWQRRSGFG